MPDPKPRLDAALQGRYRVERKLGEGGMATVYLAEDLKHERKVALKVLKPELAAVVGAERFLTEIKTTANLQHPHILPLYDSGEADGLLFYVMPFVRGESLRERLEREHQLPVDDAVGIATNMAEALDYAHRQGVIHRDIKPANVMLQDGKPIIADFGIALAVGAAGGGRLTETGLSLGTPHYMSPEQATGDQNVGPATDIYALGCVLYEMLVGEPPFTGSTPQAVLGKIITGQPEPARAQRPSVPSNVDAAIRTSLARVPADRFRGATHFARALRDSAYTGPSSGTGATTRPDRRLRTVTAFAGVLGILAAWGWLDRASTEVQQVTRTSISLDGDHRLAIAWAEAFPLAISPDGRQVAYVGESTSGTRLYVRPLGSFETTPMAGTDGARQPFFSPDGTEVGYFDRRYLNRVSASGGGRVRIVELPNEPGTDRPIVPSGGAWGPDGVIVFATADSVLWRVSVAGPAEPEAIPLTFAEGDDAPLSGPTGDGSASLGLRTAGARWPYFLPASRQRGDVEPRVLVKVGRELVTVSLSDGSARLTGVQAGGQGIFVTTGHVVTSETSGQVHAWPFDLESGYATGAAVPLLDDVFRPVFTSATLFAVAPEAGTLVFVTGGSARTVWLVDRGGRGRRLTEFEPRDYRLPSFSPDGRRLAVDIMYGGIQILDFSTGGRVDFPELGGGALWSPDGREFATGSPSIRLDAVAGSVPRPFPEAPDSSWLNAWGSSGRLLFTMPYTRGPTGARISIALEGSGRPAEVLIDTESNEVQPRLSPDGRWLVYVSDASGRPEVYIRGLDGPEGSERTVSIAGGDFPIWSRSGEEIFYWRAEELYSVRVLSTEPLRLSEPQLLFEGRYHVYGPMSWDVSPSGEFVLISSGPNWRRQINVVQNFHQELTRLVPH